MIQNTAAPNLVSLQWYYANESGHAGPITIEDLRDLLQRGAVSRDTLVWNEGFGQTWKPIRDTEVGLALKKGPLRLPPPLPQRTASKWRLRIEVLVALAAGIVAAAILFGIGSLSFQICLYASILFAVVSGILLLRPIPKVLLTRLSGAAVLTVAGVSALASAVGLQHEEKKFRDTCMESRSVAGCTRIINDNSVSSAYRAVALRNRGVGYHREGDLDRAIADYSEALKFDTKDATVYSNRGLAYHAKGDGVRAVADYTEAITLDPQYEKELEDDFKSLAPEAYTSLVAERRAKQEQLRKAEISSLKTNLKSSGLDLDAQHKIYRRLSELEQSDASHKREADKLGKQIDARAAAQRAAEEKARQEAETKTAGLKMCRSDWTKCADNEQLVNNYSGWVSAQVACKMEANSQARYGDPVWPWLAFGSFYGGKEYVASGSAVLIEPDAKFQNGFSAMVRSRVICTYDLRAKRVISVNVSPR